uniref:Uncharacterized protein n=1 Tax=Anopheles farauti TaxID=69004 RepID=A0A182QNI4_9DIPT
MRARTHPSGKGWYRTVCALETYRGFFGCASAAVKGAELLRPTGKPLKGIEEGEHQTMLPMMMMMMVVMLLFPLVLELRSRFAFSQRPFSPVIKPALHVNGVGLHGVD